MNIDRDDHHGTAAATAACLYMVFPRLFLQRFHLACVLSDPFAVLLRFLAHLTTERDTLLLVALDVIAQTLNMELILRS